MLILGPDCHIHADLQNIGSQLLFHLGYAVFLVWIQKSEGKIKTKQVIKINKNSGSWWLSDYIIVYMKGPLLSHIKCENRGIVYNVHPILRINRTICMCVLIMWWHAYMTEMSDSLTHSRERNVWMEENETIYLVSLWNLPSMESTWERERERVCDSH